MVDLAHVYRTIDSLETKVSSSTSDLFKLTFHITAAIIQVAKKSMTRNVVTNQNLFTYRALNTEPIANKNSNTACRAMYFSLRETISFDLRIRHTLITDPAIKIASRKKSPSGNHPYVTKLSFSSLPSLIKTSNISLPNNNKVTIPNSPLSTKSLKIYV